MSFFTSQKQPLACCSDNQKCPKLSSKLSLTLSITGMQLLPAFVFSNVCSCPSKVAGCWCDYLSGARCRLAYQPADVNVTQCLLLL